MMEWGRRRGAGKRVEGGGVTKDGRRMTGVVGGARRRGQGRGMRDERI